MPDPIKKSTTYDPSTGETTFKASWNGISKGSITPKGTQRTVAARQAVRNVPAKPASTVKETSGERKAVAFKSPTPAKAVGMDIKTTMPKVIPTKPERKIKREIAEAKGRAYQFEKEKKEKELLKQYPGKTLNQIYNKQERESNRANRKEHRENIRIQKRDSFGGGVRDKQKSGACRTC